MKTIILTGFEPFGPYQHNPTVQSTLDFHGRTFGDRIVIGIVLPCVYNAWSYLISGIHTAGDVHAVINTGLSSSVQGMRIESHFTNVMNGKYADAEGYMPQGIPVIEHGPPAICSRASHKRLFDTLIKHDIPAERSEDAEQFICNALGYCTSLSAWKNDYFKRNLFVHIPWTTAYQDVVKLEPGKMFLEQEAYYRGLELLIKNI